MRIEHIGYQHPDPAGAADWYVEHLGFKIVRGGPPPANARFVADSEGKTLLELYANPDVPMPDYAAQSPMILHLAVCVDDVGGTQDRLVVAGATPGEITTTDGGDEFVILSDPWGFPLQLMRRAEPMV